MTGTPFAAESNALTVLEVRQDGTLSHSLPVTKDAVVIGRRAGVDCRLEHETVSRLHAVIYRDPGGPWRVRDLGSHNGTYVGPRKITNDLLGPNTSATIGVFELRLVRTLARTTPNPTTDEHPSTAEHRPEFTQRDEDRTASIVAPASDDEIPDEYRQSLADLARRVRVLESPAARRHQLCDFLRRTKDLGVLSALVVISRPANAPSHADTPQPRLLTVSTPAAETPPDEGLPTALIERVLEVWQPLRGAPHAANADITMTSLGFPEAVEVLACPIAVSADDTAEVLVAAIGPREPGTQPGNTALRLVTLAAKQYAAAIEEAAALDLREEYRSYRDQLRLAEQIQRSLIPTAPTLPGLDVALVSAPSERVSGDYIDAFPIDESRSIIVLADVTGHGLAAAMVAAQIHTMVHAHSWAHDTDLAAFVTRASRYLCRFTPEHISVTALALLHDARSNQIQLVNAGHHPILICHPGRPTTQTTAGHNALLGIEHFIGDPVNTETIQLEDNAYVVGYSDGIPEQRDPTGELLGHRRAAAIVTHAIDNAKPKETATDIARRIALSLDTHQALAQQSDDRSLFIIRRRTTTHRENA